MFSTGSGMDTPLTTPVSFGEEHFGQAPLGNRARVQRLIRVANSMAVAAHSGELLGLAHQILHRRADVPKGETEAAKRERATRESLLWIQACTAIGPAPAGCTWVDVCDRGADTFEFLDSEVVAGR